MPPSVVRPSAPPMDMISKHEEEERTNEGEGEKEEERVKRKLGKLGTVAPECPVCISN